MSDADLRALVRLAEEQGDPTSWERAARGFAREHKWEQARSALARARELGADTRAAEELLEELPWPALAPRNLEVEAPPVSEIAWSPSGETLFAVAGERSVVALEPDAETSRIVAVLPGTVVALAPEPAGRGLLVAELVPSTTGRPTSRVRRIEEGSREVSWELVIPRAVRSLALAPRGRGLVWSSFQHRVYAHRFDAQGRPEAEPYFDAFRVQLTGAGEAVRATSGEAEVLAPIDLLTAPALASVDVVKLTEAARALIETALHARFPTGRAFLRFASSERLAAHATGAFASASVLAVSPAGRNVAIAATRDGTVKVADLATGAERTFALGPVSAAAWSPCGRRLAIATTLGLFLVESPPDAVAALESEWRTIQARHGAGKPALWERLEQDARPEVTGWLLKQLEPRRKADIVVLDIIDAVRCLARRRVPADVERVRRARRRLPARPGFPGLADYREELDWLVLVLEGVARGERCNCALPFATPGRHGSLEREGPGSHAGTVYRCAICGRRWRLEKDEELARTERFIISPVDEAVES